MSNCMNDDLKSCNNNVLGPKSIYLFICYNFPLILNVFLNIHIYMQTIYILFAYVVI